MKKNIVLFVLMVFLLNNIACSCFNKTYTYEKLKTKTLIDLTTGHNITFQNMFINTDINGIIFYINFIEITDESELDIVKSIYVLGIEKQFITIVALISNIIDSREDLSFKIKNKFNIEDFPFYISIDNEKQTLKNELDLNASPIILIIDRNSSIIYNHYGIGYYIIDEIENFLKKRKMSETGLTTLLRIPGDKSLSDTMVPVKNKK